MGEEASEGVGAVEALMEESVLLSNPKPGRKVFMFLDANVLFWRSYIALGILVEETHHELVVFVSGTLKGSQLWWPTVDEGTFAVVSAFRILNHLL